MPDRPNVILVVTDDQGYGDLACHGNPYIRTPHMDSLYHESVRCPDFHVDPTCSPTRAALLTGCYSHRVNVWHTIMGRNYLDSSVPTVAELFRDAGYRTGHFGKWHLGGHFPYRPMDRGFEEWLGQGDGGTGCTSDHWGNRRVDDIYLHNGTKRRIEGYGPDVFFDAAIDFIESSSSEPFFVYLATYIPHNPTSLPDTSWVDRYRGDVPIETGYFYSSIERADYNLGRLRAKLEQLQIDEDTILIFMTDNGTAQGHHVYNAGMRGNKGSVYEGGHRVPFFIRWPAGGIGGGRECSGLTAHIDLLPTLLDLAGLEGFDEIKTGVDGMSIAPWLQSGAVPDRTLVVESQRVPHPEKYRSYSVMRGAWRLVGRDELYDLTDDPGQQRNVIEAHRDVANELQRSYEEYWPHVSVHDDRFARPEVGGTSSRRIDCSVEHLFPDSEDAFVWNQQHVLVGKEIHGFWPIEVVQAGRYQVECRRWPDELDAPIDGVPADGEALAADRAPSFLFDEEVEDTLYGAQAGGTATPLAVATVSLESNGHALDIPVTPGARSARAELELEAGPAQIRAEMRAADGTAMGAPYYVYITGPVR